jgi:H/ACA ribonucleoprotein complex non-core subunit NAF1
LSEVSASPKFVHTIGPSRRSDSVSDSSNDSDSDDSDGSDEKIPDLREEEDVEDEEEPDARAVVGGTVFLTKNEVPETDIHVPEIEEVDPEETLEKVGQVMSIVENTVIVKGHAAEVQGKASERALDSETLLVFEDRKVLGYVSTLHCAFFLILNRLVQIYETFGPTSQPLYQVKFNHARPVDPERIWIAREVFHVPQRSNFVFLSQIRHLKGSDASNLHDEEPAEDELEFSDDEKEAASRSLRKRKYVGLLVLIDQCGSCLDIIFKESGLACWVCRLFT